MKTFKNIVLIVLVLSTAFFAYKAYGSPSAAPVVGYTEADYQAGRENAQMEVLAEMGAIVNTNPTCVSAGKTGLDCVTLLNVQPQKATFMGGGAGPEDASLNGGSGVNLADGLVASGKDINPDWNVQDLHPGTPNAGWQVIPATMEVRRFGVSSDPGTIQVLDPSGNVFFTWDSQGKGYTAWIEVPAEYTLRFKTGWNDANLNWNSWVEQYKFDALGDLSWKGDPRSLNEREDKPFSWEWNLSGWTVIHNP